MEISIIIPSYNQPHSIENCLKSLLKQQTTFEYEIIIVDSSKPNVQAVISEICTLSNKIHLIKRKEQTFPGAARNIGIKNAKGKIIALIDSDCVALEGWIENIGRNVKDNLIVSGVIENGTPKNIFGTCSYLIEFNHFTPFKARVKTSKMAATCNFATKRSTFDRLGYFSHYRAFEDMLFCKKFIEITTGQIKLFSDIRIKHINRTDLSHVLNNQRLLGKYSAIARKEYKMPPQVILNNSWLTFLLIPFRYFSILSRLFFTKNLTVFLFYSPIIIYILFYWSKGFREGASLK